MKDIKDYTIRELERYRYFCENAESTFDLSLENLEMLCGTAVDIKDKRGEWQELDRTNYDVIISCGNRITIVIDSCIIDYDNFEKEYDVHDERVVIPRYTGYYEFLNGDSEDLLEVYKNYQ